MSSMMSQPLPVFARRVYLGAAIYGLITLVPLYFLEHRFAAAVPAVAELPLLFYGFLGLALTWQGVFALIGHDPRRYRPLMPVAMLEKLAFIGTAAVLYLLGRIPAADLLPVTGDCVLVILFLLAWRQTATPTATGQEPAPPT